MPTDSPLEQRVRGRLSDLRTGGLFRSLRAPSGLDLSSNDYLALSAEPRVVSRFIEGATREGCGSTGSRLLRGERDCFTSVERAFASFKGAERALYFSSGYLANLAVLTTLAEPGDVIVSDRLNHASLIDGMRLSRARSLVFPHNDVGRLAEVLAHRGEPGIRLVVVESLFSMDGDIAPLAEYAALCRSTGAVLVVDEAHAVGVYGRRGSGLLEEAGIAPDACVSINTAGKALGVTGAFVAGPAWVVEYLIQRARPFVFSTAPPPAVADAIEASLGIVVEEPQRRERLARLSTHLRQQCAARGLPVAAGRSQIVPVLIGENERAVAVAERLQGAGFDVRAVRPPAVPSGTARLRVSVNAGLSEGDLDRFIDALAAALSEVGVCSAVSS
jgi:8-amino-7-oxononanoate synthase